MKHSFLKSMEYSKSNFKREVHSYIGLPQETGKFPINSLPSQLKELERENKENSKYIIGIT